MFEILDERVEAIHEQEVEKVEVWNLLCLLGTAMGCGLSEVYSKG